MEDIEEIEDINTEDIIDENTGTMKRGRVKGQQPGMIKLVDGSFVEESVIIRAISDLKRMNWKNKEIAAHLKLASESTVRYHWKKVKDSILKKTKISSSVMIAESLDMLESLRVNGLEALNTTSFSKAPGIYITLLKTVKDLVLAEISFKERTNLIKPVDDNMSDLGKKAQLMSVNELKSVISNLQSKIKKIDASSVEEPEENNKIESSSVEEPEENNKIESSSEKKPELLFKEYSNGDNPIEEMRKIKLEIAKKKNSSEDESGQNKVKILET